MPRSVSDNQPELPLFPSSASQAGDAGVQRRFLGWNQAVLAATVGHLCRHWDGQGALDLSGRLIVVPTRHAGRRLREALAIRAAESGAAVLPPLVTTPDFLTSPARLEPGERPAASPRITHLTWTGLIHRLETGSYRRIFPIDPVERSVKWAANTAREFLAVRQLLAEHGLDFAAAAEILARHDLEPGRWEELARLETEALRLTEELGFEDESAARMRSASEGGLPGEIEQIVVAGLADLKPLAIRALNRLAERMPVELLVFAPEAEANDFDEWGRPKPSRWLEREIRIDQPAATVHQAANPARQAEIARRLIEPHPNPSTLSALGIPAPEIAPALEQELARHGLGSHDPAGLPVSNEGICYLIRLIHEAAVAQTFDAFLRLLRCPGFAAAALRALGEEKSSATALMRDFDDLAVTCLPFSLSDAAAAARRTFPKKPLLSRTLEWAMDRTARLHKEDLAEGLIGWLSEIFADLRFFPHDSKQAAFAEVADAIHSLSDELSATAGAFRGKLSLDDRFEILHSALRERRIYPERASGDVDLQGWLELMWEDAPHLVVTGMNDHVVPESIVSHPFLPDTARRALDIQHNDDRFARDAYLLTVAIEARRKKGYRIDLVFGRQSDNGDPLRPSRLLFQCRDSELAERTLHLFKEQKIDRPPLARSVAWKLKPEALADDNPVFQKISVTGFKQYLACPFRFYLRHGLGMEAIDLDKRELDARDFGNLIHYSLEALGKGEAIRHSRNPEEVADFLLEELDRQIEHYFGRRLSTPVTIQRESARQRLSWWAEHETNQRLEGWEIVDTEAKLGDENWPFEIAGLPVRGRIDRIERHPERGFRVFDFKTFSPRVYHGFKSVAQFHLANLRRSESPDDFPRWMLWQDENGKRQRWTDLQIPLYQIALAQRHPGVAVAVGYVTLGKAEDEVRADLWDTLDEATLSSALACAEGVVEAIRRREFWPPSQNTPPWDEFRDLLSPTPDNAIDPSSLTAATIPN